MRSQSISRMRVGTLGLIGAIALAFTTSAFADTEFLGMPTADAGAFPAPAAATMQPAAANPTASTRAPTLAPTPAGATPPTDGGLANGSGLVVLGVPRSQIEAEGQKFDGYLLDTSTLATVHVAGPSQMLLNTLGVGAPNSVVITLDRDQQERSVNNRVLSPSSSTLSGEPLSRPVQVEVTVPAGEHDYRITVSRRAFVEISLIRVVYTDWVAAPEEPIGNAVSATPALGAAAAPPPTFIITPVVGTGFAVDDGVGQASPSLVFGADARYVVHRTDSADMLIGLTLRDHAGSQTYLTNLGSGATGVSTEEQMIQTDLDFAYDLHPVPRLVIGPFAGVGFRFFANDTSPANIGGLYPGGELRFAVTDQLEVRARGSYLYDLFFSNSGSISALGPPHAAADASAGIAVAVGGNHRLRIEYEGEDDAFKHSYRYYHSLCFSLDLGI